MANPIQVNDLKMRIIQNLKDRNVPEYRPEQLEKAESVGPGGSGGRASVYWKKLDDGKLVAIKCLSRSIESQVVDSDYEQPSAGEKREKLFKYFERECSLWYMGSKESDDSRFSKIVRLLGFTRSYEGRIFPSLVLELYPEGDLRSLVSKTPTLAEKERVRLLCDVASGLAYLHKPDLMIVHRDIKGQNILVRKRSDGKLSAAIGDFGSAKILDPQVFPIINSSFTESLFWTPPEYIVDGREDFSNPTIFGDVWSFGCTLIEVMSGADPWTPNDRVIKHLSGELRPTHPRRPRCIKEGSKHWSLAQSCFELKPDVRPTGRLLENSLLDFYVSE